MVVAAPSTALSTLSLHSPDLTLHTVTSNRSTHLVQGDADKSGQKKMRLRDLSWNAPTNSDLVFVGLDVKGEGGEGSRRGESRHSLVQEGFILGIVTWH